MLSTIASGIVMYKLILLATLIVGSELFDFFLFAVDIAVIVFAVDLVFV